MPYLVAIMAQAYQVAVLFPPECIPDLQRKLRVTLDILVVMDRCSSGINPPVFAVLALVLVHLQYLPTHTLPLTPGIETVDAIADALPHISNITLRHMASTL